MGTRYHHILSNCHLGCGLVPLVLGQLLHYSETHDCSWFSLFMTFSRQSFMKEKAQKLHSSVK